MPIEALANMTKIHQFREVMAKHLHRKGWARDIHCDTSVNDSMVIITDDEVALLTNYLFNEWQPEPSLKASARIMFLGSESAFVKLEIKDSGQLGRIGTPWVHGLGRWSPSY